MKRLLILSLMVGASALVLGSCNKDSDPKPEEEIVGTWKGKEAKVIVYGEDGKEIITEQTINLGDPNFAQATFNKDETFSVELKLKTPMLVNETRVGTYEIKGQKIRFNFTNVDDDPEEAPFTLRNNTLTFTLGSEGSSTLTYTLIRSDSAQAGQ